MLPPWKQLKGALVCACGCCPASSSTLTYLSAFPAHTAVPIHVLLGSLPTLVAAVHAEEYYPSSRISLGVSRALWSCVFLRRCTFWLG